MRRAAALSALFLGLAAAPARADDLTPAQRGQVEDAFFDALYADVVARLGALDPAGDARDRYPLDVLERGWRVRADLAPAAPPGPSAERWPTVTALVLERERRESRGARGLAQDSPLLGQAPDWVAWQVGLYRPPAPVDDAPRKEAAALRADALRLAAVALLALFALTGLLALVARKTT